MPIVVAHELPAADVAGLAYGAGYGAGRERARTRRTQREDTAARLAMQIEEQRRGQALALEAAERERQDEYQRRIRDQLLSYGAAELQQRLSVESEQLRQDRVDQRAQKMEEQRHENALDEYEAKGRIDLENYGRKQRQAINAIFEQMQAVEQNPEFTDLEKRALRRQLIGRFGGFKPSELEQPPPPLEEQVAGETVPLRDPDVEMEIGWWTRKPGGSLDFVYNRAYEQRLKQQEGERQAEVKRKEAEAQEREKQLEQQREERQAVLDIALDLYKAQPEPKKMQGKVVVGTERKPLSAFLDEARKVMESLTPEEEPAAPEQAREGETAPPVTEERQEAAAQVLGMSRAEMIQQAYANADSVELLIRMVEAHARGVKAATRELIMNGYIPFGKVNDAS